MLSFISFSTAVGIFILAATQVAGQANPPTIGLPEIYRLDLLAKFKASIKYGSISSYDRTGGNDDGFSGKYSFIRKEGDALVIADLKGPGAIYRIWTPTPTDDPMEFYFDGEDTPRIKSTWRGIFIDNQPPFLSPLAHNGGGGFYAYTPLTYRKSCKVIIRAQRVQFYQINYAEFPAESQIETYTADGFAAQKDHLEKARSLWSSPGSDISAYLTPPDKKSKTTSANGKLLPGKTLTLFQTAKGGRIIGIRLGPASAFARKERDLVLRAYWDGDKEPAINSPIGDFFGYAWGKPSMKSLVAGSADGVCYGYLPMPFEKSAKIELIDERKEGPPLEIHAEVISVDAPRLPDEGKFYAIWRRENPTTMGKSFTYVETQGRGHVVGVALQAQGLVSGITPFFEGDDQCWIDGELAAHGTGSEDFFNGGWYDVPGRWEGRVSFPVSGCLEYNRPMSRSGGFRFFLTDAYAYHKNILLAMEHAPEKNNLAADYCAVTYLYSEARPTMDWKLPRVEARTVTDPKRLVYAPGWYLPIHSFSMRRATVTKKEGNIDGRHSDYLSMRAEGDDIFGQHHISFLCGVPAAGKYSVSIEALEGPDQGIVQLFHQERSVGEKVDLYAEKLQRSKIIPLGELTMAEGPNQVFIKLIGKNEKASGLGFDLVSIILERTD